ncbi:myosin-binding protein 2 isoform X2 [Mangifera indica]|uniref:myosin-binding protein 2 isoform X2 n=1 Tax=Mangifera indica TaxID=29780 RepID=UPI001CFBC255|nr:myosin-binding protein 2 isoform X2 [Mangifera indica]
MAANKFATMLHRNTNKITLILVYAVLEWTLIVLLLLNSLFSYLIIKYAEYFGLKKPCVWCSRLDHMFESSKKRDSYRDLVCDDHAKEISKLGFCSNHHTLSESKDMCEDCSSSSHHEFLKDYAFFPWMKKIGMVQNGEDGAQNGEVEAKCSCCGVKLERKFYSPYELFKPSWEVLDYPKKENLIEEGGDDGHFDQSRSDSLANQLEEVQKIAEDMGILIEGRELVTEEIFSRNEEDKVDAVIEKEQESSSLKEEALNASMEDPSCDESKKEATPEIVTKHLEFYIDGEDCHLIPVELMDPATAEVKSGYKLREEGEGNGQNEDVILDFTMNDFEAEAEVEFATENMKKRVSSEEAMASLSAHESEEQTKAMVLEPVEEEDENEWSSFIQAEVGDLIEDEHVAQTPQTPSVDAQEAAEAREETAGGDFNQVSDDVFQMQSEEINGEISIGTEIPEHEPIDDIQNEQGHFASSSELHVDDDENGFKTIKIEGSEEATIDNFSKSLEVIKIEEEKVPDTPSSVDSLHRLQKKFLLLDRRESGAEESLDGGSVLSDIDSGDGVMTVEGLKSTLRAERKALNALYAELEEERSASAVATNQTMAMINRLQEEKAAMQMEALQYQRMMEEQSEYDQEALQLLNELMIKREREKAEVEKELELYRKKVQEYEAKERMMMLRRSRTSSASCSNGEDSDSLSVDLNHEAREEESPENNQESSNQKTPADAVLYLETSLANFEEERLSILEQLKVLEEKLFVLNDEEERIFEHIKSADHLHKENGNGYTEDYDFEGETNGLANGYFKEMNGKLHYQGRKILGAKAKRLLPLFDAIGTETEDGILNGHELEFNSVASQNSSITKFELDCKRNALEEEVDYVYERLQALEADREFLKHCITSLRKGDKGVILLQEILQHLRDLRSVEHRARNIENVNS